MQSNQQELTLQSRLAAKCIRGTDTPFQSVYPV